VSRKGAQWTSRWKMAPVVGMLAAAVLTAGCAEDGADPMAPVLGASLLSGPVGVTLPAGGAALLAEGALRLTFRRVVEDSRCPVEVTCVWEGNAVVEVAVSLGSAPAMPLQLNTTLEPRSRIHEGLRVSLLELRPEPRSQGSSVEGPEPAYEVDLRLERVEG